MSKTVIVIGGDAAGMSAASKLKREAPDTEVIVFEKGQWVSYAACGMPYFVKGEVEAIEDLVQVTPEEFIEERDIDLRLGHEVTAIDTDARTVTVRPDDGEPFEQSYDDLLIGTGARAIVPPFDGMDHEGVFTLHSMDSAVALREAVHDLPQDDRTSVAVIGGGYVGIEMAEAFEARGFSVHLFEMLPNVLAPFGTEVAPLVEDELRAQGVTLHLETRVEGFDGDGRVKAVRTEDETVPVDLVVVGVGVAPNSELAEAAGIELGESGAIATDEFGRTSAHHVYAAGDCAEATHTVTGEPDWVPLALTANRAGRAIGQTLAGDPRPVGEIAGTATVKAFDLEVARTGIIEEERAHDAGFDSVSVTIEAPSRAHYYPGATPLTVQLVGDRDSGRVLGAAMVGREGVPKRIDTVAAALHEGATVRDLEYYDLAYAPPFSPTWDPVLTAARVLEGKLE